MSVDEEMFFSPNTDVEVSKVQHEIEKILNEEDGSGNERRFFRSNNQSNQRSRRMSGEGYQTQEPGQSHLVTPKLQGNMSSNQGNNSIAEQNLRALQAIILILQSLEIENSELDEALKQLLTLNERGMLTESEVVPMNPMSLYSSTLVDTSTLIERNRIQSMQNMELLQYNRQLQQTNSDLTVQMMDLENSVEILSQQCQAFDEQNQLLQQERDQLIEEQRMLFQYVQEQPCLNKYYVDTRQSTPNDVIMLKLEKFFEERITQQEQLDNAYTQLQGLQNQQNQLLQQNSNRQEQNVDLRNENEELQEQVKHLQSQIEDYKRSLEDLSNQIEELDTQIINYQTMYKQIQEDASSNNQINQQMIRDKEMELYKLGLERDDLRKTLSKKESLLTNIQEDFQQMIAQQEENFMSEKYMLQNQIHDLQDFKHKIEYEYDGLISHNQRVEKENIEMRDKIRQVEQQQSNMLAQHQEQILDQFQKDRDYQYQKQKEKKQLMEQENLKLNRLNMELQMRVSQVEHEKKMLRDKDKELRFEYETYRIQHGPLIDLLRKQLLDVESHLQRIKHHETELEQRVIFLESEKSDLEFANKRYNKK